MLIGKKPVLLLCCLLTAPLPAQMAGMQMNNSSPSQVRVPPPELLLGVDGRPPLKLGDFLALADKNNPTLRQAAANIRRSEALARQAALYPNPTVGYEGDQIRGGSYGGGEQGGFVAQTIVLGGKLALRSDIYQQQKQFDLMAADAQLLRVHNDVTRLFYSTVSAEQTVLVRGRLLALASDAVETAHRLANVGQADEPDVLQAEVEREQAQIDYTLAQRIFMQTFSSLAAFAGSPLQPLTHLDATLDSLPEVDAVGIVDSIVQQSPTVKQARQQVSIAVAKLKAARREVIPDLQLRAGEQENFEALSQASDKKTGAQSFASAGIELPLWNRNQGNVSAAEAEVEHARQEVTRTQLALRQQADMQLQNYLSAKLEAEQYRTSLLPRARSAYQLYLDKYQDMAQAYPQVILSQRTLFQLEAHYIESLDRVWQSAIALENFTLQGGLDLSGMKGN